MLDIPKLTLTDLGRFSYVKAWEQQCLVHDKVLSKQQVGEILLVEHDPVITLSRRKTVAHHLLADEQKLTKLGIDLQQTNRGGDITYHGPGQLVAYPIFKLADFKLTVGSYMRLLEEVVVRTLATFPITGVREQCKTGVWVQRQPNQPTEKICAMGIRLKRGISLHGLALNLDPDMEHFNTIVPCGIGDRSVTSIKQCLGDSAPDMQTLKTVLVEQFAQVLGCEIVSSAI